MIANITNPTKVVFSEYTEADIEKLKKKLKYVDKNIDILIKKHLNNKYFRNSNFELWSHRLEELRENREFNLLHEENNEYWTRPGVLPYLDIDMKINNKIKYPELKKIPWKYKIPFNPYNYQQTSVNELLNAKHGCVSLATGLGKSLILLMLAREVGDCVVVTPSKSIFNELLKSFQHHLGRENVGGYGAGKKDIKKPITIAIGKSLTLIKKDTPEYVFFKNKTCLMVDESHCWSASTLEKVCHGVLANVPYRFFASATQVNNSGKTILLNSIIGKCVCSMNIGSGIDQGYLCPLKFQIASVPAMTHYAIKDPLKCKRENFLYNFEIAKLYANIANASWNIRNESTLILVEELKQIKMLVEHLKVPYAYVHSGSKKEAEKHGLEKVDLQTQVDKFNKGEVKVLIGTRAISTGTNMYPTHNTCNFMGGSSEIITKQGAMGRSTRKLEISKYKDYHKPKPFTRVWDVRVEDQPVLDNHLTKRVNFYKEAGGEINYS